MVVVRGRLVEACGRRHAHDVLSTVEAVVGRGRADVLASTAMPTVFGVALCAETHTAAHRPVAEQTGQED